MTDLHRMSEGLWVSVAFAIFVALLVFVPPLSVIWLVVLAVTHRVGL